MQHPVSLSFADSPEIPVNSAECLPRDAWWSKPFSDHEDERIWSKLWVAVGYPGQLPQSGDILPYTIGNHGIHIERNDDGTMSGYFNFVQHGGCRSIPLQCQTGRKTRCSYLSCGYSRDQAEGFPTSLNRKSLQARHFTGFQEALRVPIQLQLCGNVIFANIDPLTSDLSTISPLPAVDGAAQFLTMEFPCNWKLLWREILSEFSDKPEHQGAFLHGRSSKAKPLSVTAFLPNYLLLQGDFGALSAILQPTGTELTFLRLTSWNCAPDQPTIDLISICAERAVKQQLAIRRGNCGPKPISNLLDASLMFWLDEQLGTRPDQELPALQALVALS